jgi:riboflavin kinase / FMN adenylyltransferase
MVPVQPSSPPPPSVTVESLAGSPTLVSIGNFDGVHRGHQAVLKDSATVAMQHGLLAVALTFSPHPTIAVGRPPPACLTRLDRKVELIQRIDPRLRVVVQHFDAAFAAQSPEAFVRDILVERLNARLVRVGENFRFGAARRGDLHTLIELGKEHGLEAQAEPLIGDEQGRYSSTRARENIRAGNLPGVVAILGRPHSLSGKVVEGQKRARQLGFPTANLGWVVEALPRHGVYTVAVDRLNPDGIARRLGLGVVNVGVRPTVDAGFAVEAHILDYHGDLYGAPLRVHLLSFIRPERKFEGLDALKAQIEDDVRGARGLLRETQPAPDAGEAWF